MMPCSMLGGELPVRERKPVLPGDVSAEEAGCRDGQDPAIHAGTRASSRSLPTLSSTTHQEISPSAPGFSGESMYTHPGLAVSSASRSA
jgi:hypothetical protein